MSSWINEVKVSGFINIIIRLNNADGQCTAQRLLPPLNLHCRHPVRQQGEEETGDMGGLLSPVEQPVVLAWYISWASLFVHWATPFLLPKHKLISAHGVPTIISSTFKLKLWIVELGLYVKCGITTWFDPCSDVNFAIHLLLDLKHHLLVPSSFICLNIYWSPK